MTEAGRNPAAAKVDGRCVAVLSLGAAAVVAFVHDRASHEGFTVPRMAFASAAFPALAALVFWLRSRAGAVVPRAAWAGLGVLVAGVASASVAPAPRAAGEALREPILVFAPAFLLGALALRTDARRAALAEVMGWTGALAALIGLAQANGLDGYAFAPSDAVAWEGRPAAGALRALYDAAHRVAAPRDLPDVAWAGPVEPLLRRAWDAVASFRWFSSLPRTEGPPAAVFGHANLASEIVAAGAAALTVRLVGDFGASRLLRPARLLVAPLRLAAIAACLGYLSAVGSRAAVLALAATAVLAATAWIVSAPAGRRRRRALVGVALFAAAFAALAAVDRAGAVRGAGPAESLFERLGRLVRPPDPTRPAEAARDTVAERRILWANTSVLVKERGPATDAPWRTALGLGPGQWEIRYPEVSDAVAIHPRGTYTLRRRPDHPHQDALEFLAEYGLVGTAAGVLFAACATAGLFARRRLGGAGANGASAVGAAAATLAAASFASFTYRTATPLVWTGLAAGAMAPAALAAGSRAARGAASSTAAIAGALYGGACLLVGETWAAAIAVAAGLGAAALRSARRVSDGESSAARAALGLVALAAAVAATAWRVADGAPAFESWASGVAVALAVVATFGGFEKETTWSPALCRTACVAFAAGALLGALGGRSAVAAERDRRRGAEALRFAQLHRAERPRSLRDAADAFDRAAARAPRSFLVASSRADAYAAAGRTDEAELSARRALLLHPRFANPLVLQANLAFVRNDRYRAVWLAEEALRWNAGSSEARLILARALDAAGDRRRALAEYELAAAAAPPAEGDAEGWAPLAHLGAAAARLRAGVDLDRAAASLALAA
ncbi:MAG TPA: O-antigen ligase family protein, partial [Planctomycetota bacterium]|nr:O-antigen ligase family protein [Planctomycetota bacterium]